MIFVVLFDRICQISAQQCPVLQFSSTFHYLFYFVCPHISRALCALEKHFSPLKVACNYTIKHCLPTS